MKKLNKPKESNKPLTPEKQYLSTHLKDMDKVRKSWYMNTMKTWKKEDYENYEKFHLWIIGAEFDN